MTPEDVVRAYFAAYSDGHPERFDELVSPEYVDYGHTTPGHGPQGARDDYEHAVELAGGLIRYDIGALVAGEDTVAWTVTRRVHGRARRLLGFGATQRPPPLRRPGSRRVTSKWTLAGWLSV